jgi:hypothetical protein
MPNFLRTKRLVLYFLVMLLAHIDGKGATQIKIFKISVLASGAVLLDGKRIEMADLEGVLQGARNEGATVWYYRESPATEPPPQAREVLDLILKNRLSISFSTKPDFSDYMDADGISRPRIPETARRDPFDARMPEVKAVPDIEQIFADARKKAAGKNTPRALIIVLPERKLGAFPVGQHSKSDLEKMESIVPSAVKRNIAVVGYTGFAADTLASISPRDANRAIPFFGILLGLSEIGHAVWIFEGHPTAIAAGCRDADLLIIDSGMMPFLSRGWEDAAAKVMRNPNIMVHDRTTYKLHIVRKVGEHDDRLEFHD